MGTQQRYFPLRWLSKLAYTAETLFLFTRSDYKTILFPVVRWSRSIVHCGSELTTHQTMFASATAPIHSFESWLKMLFWIWTHLLQANVSNQTHSANEDIVNKPWRPLPAGRVTERQAAILRWSLVVANLALSATIGQQVMYVSAALALVEFVHDDMGLSHHPVLKNVCNIGGYGTFQAGATLILCMPFRFF